MKRKDTRIRSAHGRTYTSRVRHYDFLNKIMFLKVSDAGNQSLVSQKIQKRLSYLFNWNKVSWLYNDGFSLYDVYFCMNFVRKHTEECCI